VHSSDAELDAVLVELVERSTEILGDDFVGAYLQGSFALGAGDRHSDCDFIVVVRREPDAQQEAELRALHAELPHRDGFWFGHLEGSYAGLDDLADPGTLGREWLYVDHGWDTMQWSDHCNQPWTRWILRHHGITLSGPPPAELVADVPPEVMRGAARAGIPTLVEDIASWCPREIAWCQRYLVVSACRALYTARTAEVTSKRDAVTWAAEQAPEWGDLLTQVLSDRERGFDQGDAPTAQEWQRAEDFARHVATLV
jgi:hypothetical protein